MTMRIVVKQITNKTTMILNCNSKSTGAEIKAEIHKKWKVHPKDQRLIFGRGKILSDDAILKAIPELNGTNNIVHLVIRLPESIFVSSGPISSRLRSKSKNETFFSNSLD